jgi:hypothetical protein
VRRSKVPHLEGISNLGGRGEAETEGWGGGGRGERMRWERGRREDEVWERGYLQLCTPRVGYIMRLQYH